MYRSTPPRKCGGRYRELTSSIRGMDSLLSTNALPPLRWRESERPHSRDRHREVVNDGRHSSPQRQRPHSLCIEGNALLYEWCATHNVRAHRIGKLVVAVDGDRAALDALHQRAIENGVPGIEMISDAARLRELEPQARCVAAMWSPTTGVVDQSALMRSFAAETEAHGGMIALKHNVTSIERRDAGLTLRMTDPEGAEA